MGAAAIQSVTHPIQGNLEQFSPRAQCRTRRERDLENQPLVFWTIRSTYWATVTHLWPIWQYRNIDGTLHTVTYRPSLFLPLYSGLFLPSLVATRSLESSLLFTSPPPSERQYCHIYREIRQQSEGQELLKNAGARCFHQMVTASAIWRLPPRGVAEQPISYRHIWLFFPPLAFGASLLVSCHFSHWYSRRACADGNQRATHPSPKSWKTRGGTERFFQRRWMKTTRQLSGFELFFARAWKCNVLCSPPHSLFCRYKPNLDTMEHQRHTWCYFGSFSIDKKTTCSIYSMMHFSASTRWLTETHHSNFKYALY